MILSLGVQANKTKQDPLKRSDISVLGIDVSSTWNSKKIGQVLERTTKKVGKPPLYVISDNDSKLKKAIGDASYTHIPDIGHTMAMFVERIYKNEPDFKSYTQEVSQVKIREVMRNTSYLLPPRQRTIARFLNISPTINWSKKIESNFGLLTDQEQLTFGFVNNYTSLIHELDCVFDYINYVLEYIKTKGLSQANIKHALGMFSKKLTFKSPRINRLKSFIEDYLSSKRVVLELRLVYGTPPVI